MRQQLLYVPLAVLHHYRETFEYFTVSLETPFLSCHKPEKAYSGQREKRKQKFTKIVQMHRAFRCGCWSGQCARETSCLELSYAQGLHAGFTLARTGCPKSEGKCETAGRSLRLPHRTWCLVKGALKWRTEGWVWFDRQMGRMVILLTEHEEDQPCAEYKWKSWKQ